MAFIIYSFSFISILNFLFCTLLHFTYHLPLPLNQLHNLFDVHGFCVVSFHVLGFLLKINNTQIDFFHIFFAVAEENLFIPEKPDKVSESILEKTCIIMSVIKLTLLTFSREGWITPTSLFCSMEWIQLEISSLLSNCGRSTINRAMKYQPMKMEGKLKLQSRDWDWKSWDDILKESVDRYGEK